MYKIKSSLPYNLTESGQANPIRWTLVHKDGDTLQPLAAEMKCKDYFNDIVAAKRGVFFKQYGFDNKLWLQQPGCDVLLTGLVDYEKFTTAVAKVTHPDHPVVLEKILEDVALLHIPEYYFLNTYRISLLTYMIRLCNNNVGTSEFKGIETTLTSDLAQQSAGLSSQGREFAIKHGWDVPDGDKYWWRTSKTYNSDNNSITYGIGQIIHNCGVNGWAAGLIAELAGEGVDEDENEDENV